MRIFFYRIMMPQNLYNKLHFIFTNEILFSWISFLTLKFNFMSISFFILLRKKFFYISQKSVFTSFLLSLREFRGKNRGCVIFLTFRLSDFNTILTYVLMDNFCPCYVYFLLCIVMHCNFIIFVCLSMYVLCIY